MKTFFIALFVALAAIGGCYSCRTHPKLTQRPALADWTARLGCSEHDLLAALKAAHPTKVPDRDSADYLLSGIRASPAWTAFINGTSPFSTFEQTVLTGIKPGLQDIRSRKQWLYQVSRQLAETQRVLAIESRIQYPVLATRVRDFQLTGERPWREDELFFTDDERRILKLIDRLDRAFLDDIAEDPWSKSVFSELNGEKVGPTTAFLMALRDNDRLVAEEMRFFVSSESLYKLLKSVAECPVLPPSTVNP